MTGLLIGYARIHLRPRPDRPEERPGRSRRVADKAFTDQGLTGANRALPGLREALAAYRAQRRGTLGLILTVCLLSFGAVSCSTTPNNKPDQGFQETPIPSSTTSAGGTATKAGPSCVVREELPVRDLQNDELVDCDLKEVRILFEDGRTITTPAAGEVVSGASSTVVGAEDMDRISVANLGPGQGVVAFIENDAREVTYWGPAEATSILKEQQAKAGMAGG